MWLKINGTGQTSEERVRPKPPCDSERSAQPNQPNQHFTNHPRDTGWSFCFGRRVNQHALLGIKPTNALLHSREHGERSYVLKHILYVYVCAVIMITSQMLSLNKWPFLNTVNSRLWRCPRKAFTDD
eukprot:3329184-Pyramimonas_sp.AAC.1